MEVTKSRLIAMVRDVMTVEKYRKRVKAKEPRKGKVQNKEQPDVFWVLE
jgi:hypothetical protein